MSITTDGFRIEVSVAKNGRAFMDHAKAGFGYIEGLRIWPEWHWHALVKDKKTKATYFFIYPNRDFLKDHEHSDSEFEVLQIFGPQPENDER